MPQIGSRPRILVIGLLAAAAVLGSGASATLAATIAPTPSSPAGLFTLLTPTVTTVVHNAVHTPVTSVVVGSTVHPSASVTGSGGTPTGGVSVYTYANGTCSGTWKSIYGGVLTNGSIDATWLPFTSNDATSVSFRVSYDGNATYAAAVSACVSATFTKATPAVQIQVHDAAHHPVTAVSYGTSVHGYVEVGGAVDIPTGTASISRFASSDCSGIGTTIGPASLGGDGTLDSSYQWTFPAPGTWSFRAYYQGDSTYAAKSSSCLTFTVTKSTPTFLTSLHDASHGTAPASVMVGDVIHAAALLTSSVGTPTGTVKVYRYADAACSVIENPQTITAATTMDPAGQALTWAAPRTESWRLTYNGDTYFNSVAGPCMAVSWKAAPSVATSIHNAGHQVVASVVAGSPVHLAATVSSASGTPTGQVTFRVSTGSTCANPTPFGSKTLSGGAVDDAGTTYTPAAAGTYSFDASFGGDASYVAATSACHVLTVTAAPVPTATPKPGSTPGPTPVPTAQVTPQPGASVAPSDAASAAPSAAAPAASIAAASTAPSSDAVAPSPSAEPGTAPAQLPAATDGSGPGVGVILAGLLLLLLVALVVARWVRSSRRA